MPLPVQQFRARLPEPKRLENNFNEIKQEDLIKKDILIRYIDELIKTLRLRFESLEGEVDTINTVGALLSVLHVSGSPITSTFGDKVYLVDCTSPVVFNLPSATVSSGTVFYIKKEFGANIITVTTFGAETIDGASPHLIVGGVNTTLQIVSDGLNWFILNQFP